jgi:hypothetical protein
MSAPVAVPAQQAERRGRLWWLPGNGCGNGLDDHAWAPVLEVSRQVVPALLEILREADIPAYGAPRPPGLKSRLRSRRKAIGSTSVPVSTERPKRCCWP